MGGVRGSEGDRVVLEEAAPDCCGGEAAGCETRDDAEVVKAAFEGASEVRVG
jgi:hypothetical protein